MGISKAPHLTPDRKCVGGSVPAQEGPFPRAAELPEYRRRVRRGHGAGHLRALVYFPAAQLRLLEALQIFRLGERVQLPLGDDWR